MPDEIIEKVIQNSDIVEIISEFVSLKQSGRNFMGICPFHGDKGPSLSVSREKQLFHCFGCGASGNVIGFLMKIRNIDFLDALKILAERSGVKIEYDLKDPKALKEETIKDKIYQINIEAARFFFANLKNNKKALAYLKNREINEKTIKKFGLGYSEPDWNALQKYMKSKGYSDDLLFKAGLLSKKNENYYDKFRDRLMFPVFDIKGRVIGFGGRVFDDSKPKYLNSPETPVFTKGTNLYGLNFTLKTGIPEYIIIVEGYMDCISLHQWGINNAVASLGTALTTEQAKLLKRYSKKIYICYDSDVAGKMATLRGLDTLSNVGCEVKVVNIDNGKDPDEYIKLFGVASFLKLIDEAMPILDYKISMAKAGKNLKEAKDKSKFVSEVADILSNVNDEITIQAYASKIYDQTGINLNAILGEVVKNKKFNANRENNKMDIRYNNTSGNIYNIEPGYKKAERWLIKFSLINDNFFEYIKSNLQPSEFVSESYRGTYEYIINCKEKNEEIDINSYLTKLNNQDDISDISLILLDEKYDNGGLETIDDFIKTIKRYNLENKINEITLTIKECEKNNEIVKSAALSQELVTLKKELNRL
ncbi:DNA primase [Fervidicella metallireducens AeB]|uniref:DNA primase n=1 Tax=Fervidicella metallireducens AeB TaxID=1403537 RepID=A0A017RU67_9CLOT|nr:DNA primase [Fervidicella metallireducens AeB]